MKNKIKNMLLKSGYVAVAKSSNDLHHILDNEGNYTTLIPGDSGLYYERSDRWYQSIDHFIELHYPGYTVYILG